jgi:hypothetical protein
MKLYIKSRSAGTAREIKSGDDLQIAEQQPVKVIATGGATQELDVSQYDAFDITLTHALVITFSNFPPTAYRKSVEVKLTQAGSAGYATTFSQTILWPSATAPTLTTTIGIVSIIRFWSYDGGTTIYGELIGDNMAAQA